MGTRPRKGASSRNFDTATPLSMPRGLNSQTWFPGCSSKSGYASAMAGATLATSGPSSGCSRQCSATDQLLSSTRRPGRSRAALCTRSRSRASASGSTGTVIKVPVAVRRSSPCWPAAAHAGRPKIRSSPSIGRPLTRARAPPSAARIASSVATRPSGGATASGSSAKASKVPSASRNKADEVSTSSGGGVGSKVWRSVTGAPSGGDPPRMPAPK